MNPTVETDYIRLELLPNGILIATYKRRTLIDLTMAKEIVKTRLDFTGLEPRPVLIYNQGVIEVEREARKYVSGPEGCAGLSCAAIMQDHVATVIILSMIMALDKPPMPVKFFSKSRRAMAWLEGFLPHEQTLR